MVIPVQNTSTKPLLQVAHSKPDAAASRFYVYFFLQIIFILNMLQNLELVDAVARGFLDGNRSNAFILTESIFRFIL